MNVMNGDCRRFTTPYTSHVREVEALLWKAVARGGDSVRLWEDLDAPPSSVPSRSSTAGAPPRTRTEKIDADVDAFRAVTPFRASWRGMGCMFHVQVDTAVGKGRRVTRGWRYVSSKRG